ncbi:hypothetical protein GCM10027570_32130 [Streptomonospora sediminis]
MSDWHRSSYSDSTGGNCVEVAEGPQTLVRDSRNNDLGYLAFYPTEWTAFLRSVKDGEVEQL